MIRLQEGQEGGTRINLIGIEAALLEREREIRDAVRRRRLVADEAADPDVATAAAAARASRREHRAHPVRLTTP